MTACVNKHTKRVAAVVTASLVGALSLGVAPVAAMATDSIDMLEVDDATAFAKSDLVSAEDGKGKDIDVESLKFVAGTGKYLVPTSVRPNGATSDFEVTYGDEGNSYLQIFKAAADGVTATGSALSSADLANLSTGKYVAKVTVKANSDFYGRCTAEFPFTVVAKKLDNAVAYNLAGGNTDTAKTTFTYNTENQWNTIGFAVDGMPLIWDGGANEGTGDFELEGIYNASDMSNTNGNIYNAGDYVAKLVGVNDFAGTYAEIKFTINKLDLSTVKMWIDDTTSATAPTVADLHIDGVTDANVPGIVKLSDFKSEAGDSSYGANGAYSYTVSVIDYPADNAAVAKGNVENSGTVTFNKVTNVLTASDFKYGNAPLASSYNIDLSVDAPFDASWINADEIDRSAIDIQVTDVNGNPATVDDLKTSGTWNVFLKVNAEATQYVYGSETVKFTVSVTAGHIDADTSLVFTYKGNVVDGALDLVYSGEDFLQDIAVQLLFNGQQLTEGDDYTVTVTKDGRKEVDSIVDAGDYKISVSSSKWNITNTKTLTVKVKTLKLDKVYVGSDSMKVFGNVNYIAYTGEEIEDLYYYYLDEDDNVVRLPEDSVKVNGYVYRKEDDKATKTVKTVKAEGVYRPMVADGDADDNFTIVSGNAANNFTVSSKRVFSDVDTSYWGAENIYKAWSLDYMNGYSGSTFFGPLDSIKRGDVAVVLYKMAGQPSPAWLEGYESADGGYDTGFGDVTEGMYYAKAIAWPRPWASFPATRAPTDSAPRIPSPARSSPRCSASTPRRPARTPTSTPTPCSPTTRTRTPSPTGPRTTSPGPSRPT